MDTRQAGKLIEAMGFGANDRCWEEFVRRYERWLGIWILRLLERIAGVVRWEDVEDLRQEVYCRLLEDGRRCLRSFRGSSEGTVTAFLYRVARSVVLDHQRTVSAAKRGGDLGLELPTARPARPFEQMVDPTASPEGRILLRERRHLLLDRCRWVISRRSPGRDLQILRLALLEGWTSREIAESMAGGLSVSSIDSVVYRARRRLAAEGFRIPMR